MSLINCETSLILNWSANCVISSAAANQATTFAITNTRRGGEGGDVRDLQLPISRLKICQIPVY